MTPFGSDTGPNEGGEPQERPALDVVDALPVPVVLTRVPDGYVIYANLATVGLLHASGPQDIVGRPVSRFIDPEDLDRYENYVRMVRGGGERGDDRFHIHRLDGSRAIVEIHPMTFEHRGEPALLSVIIDATERAQAEQEVAAAEERYRTLAEMAPEGIGVQIDGRYVFVNDELVRMLGARSADELLGVPVIDIVAPEERERVAALVRATPSGGPGASRITYEMQGLDGRRFRAVVSSRRIEFDGKTAGHAIIRELPPEE